MKKLLPVIALVLAAAFMSILSDSAIAKWKKSSASPSATQADTGDKIVAVHLTSIIVSGASTHSSKEYKITAATKITVDGQPAKVSNLTTGMGVTVAPAADATVAATIDATSPGKK
jgi:hypothetical protein